MGVLFALAIACNGLAPPACTSRITLVSGTLHQGHTLSQPGAFHVWPYDQCVHSFTLTTCPTTGDAAMLLDFSFTNLGSIGQLIPITFSITPGITGDVLVPALTRL